MLTRRRRSDRSKLRSRIWFSATLLGAFLLATPAAHAQEKEKEKDSAQENDVCIADAMCRAHYMRARKLSKKDDFEGALEAYEAAYRRKPAPWLLINLGRTLHKLGRTQDAIDQYQRYLGSSDANADLRKKAEQFLQEAEADLAAKVKKDSPTGTPSDPVAATPGNLPPTSGGTGTENPTQNGQSPVPKPETKSPALNPIIVEPVGPAPYQEPASKPPVPKEPAPSRLGTLFYSGLAVGGALIVGGVITGGLGLSSAKTLQATPYTGAAEASGLPELQSRVRGLGYATDVLIPVGVATIAVTTIVSLVRKPKTEKSIGKTTVSSSPMQGSALSP